METLSLETIKDRIRAGKRNVEHQLVVDIAAFVVYYAVVTKQPLDYTGEDAKSSLQSMLCALPVSVLLSQAPLSAA